VSASGSGALPEHIQALSIPPGWTDVQYNTSPDADLLVKGRDSKGRLVYIYSEKFEAANAAEKFARIEELNKQYDGIVEENEANRYSSSQSTKDCADCQKLIMETGLRPGSDKDTMAEKQAYGATTLLGQHVVETSDGLSLQFVGKKGVSLNIAVENKDLQSMLIGRAREVGEDGKLFSINADDLRGYTGKLDGGQFTPKDFRTFLGTKTAIEKIATMSAPSNKKEYTKAVRTVAKAVSTKLGNTPTVALQAYINPSVFSEWRTVL
jgi:DNA topoisomerase I